MRIPNRWVLGAIAAVGCIVPLRSIAVALTSEDVDFKEIQRVTLVVVGLCPIVFLIGLLDARLARSAVGDLILELRSNPAPANLRAALARALRDPSLQLAYWVPDFETYVDREGREVELARGDESKATT